MEPFRLDRQRRAGPLLEWKVRLFVAGAVLGLAGMFMEEAWLTGAAIAVLAAGALLRLFAPGKSADGSDDHDGDEGPVT